MNSGSFGCFRVAGMVRAVAVAMLLAASAAADAGVEAGGPPVPDGAVSCTTSASCGVPTPYCSPVLHACVECTSDKNCAEGLSCDVARGICRSCVSDADCSPARPYCDAATRVCIECFTDANCGSAGEKCMDGQCGTCGDGICGRRERILADFGFFGSDTVSCPTDCEKLCPAHDLKSKLGKALIAGSFAGEQQLFGSSSCVSGDGPDVTLGWTPPHDGTFYLRSTGTSTAQITVWTGGCTEIGSAQCSFANPGDFIAFSFKANESVTFAIRPATNLTGTYSLDITDTPPFCDSGTCGPTTGDPSPMRDGGVSSAAAALCLDNARARGDEICAGTECACSHCPQNYDDCGVIPGCNDVRACMTEKDCIGADCYISGQCRKIVDTYGGLSGPAFRAAAGLQSCALSLGCKLPCGNGASKGDAGADAGLACEPGRVVSCPCEGGLSGEKVCERDGSAFGACVCGEPPLTPIDSGSGCKCRLGNRGPQAPSGALAVLGVAIALGWHRRSGRVRRREWE
jgi:hypothetical protein